MNWRFILVLSIFSASVVFPLQVTPETQFLNAWINEGEYYDRSLGSSAGLRMLGNFTVNKGEYVEFFICDDGNLSEWLDGNPVQVHDYQEVYSFYSFDFTVPYADTWHLIFSNVNLTSTGQRQITGYLTIEIPSYSLPSSMIDEINRITLMYYAFIVIGISVAIIAAVFVFRNREKMMGNM